MFANRFSRWLPAIVMMAAIFTFSSIPPEYMPNFDILDRFIKKGGHMVGYGILALTYWFALENTKRSFFIAWMLAVLYATSDEFHQTFVPGRHGSAWDVLIFDNLGAVIALLIASQYFNKKSRSPNNY